MDKLYFYLARKREYDSFTVHDEENSGVHDSHTNRGAWLTVGM